MSGMSCTVTHELAHQWSTTERSSNVRATTAAAQASAYQRRQYFMKRKIKWTLIPIVETEIFVSETRCFTTISSVHTL